MISNVHNVEIMNTSSTLGSSQTQRGNPYDIKSGQWFGATVRSSGPDGTVLVR